ncbi:MAG: ankyrin repeat domain-containing protein [Bacteroidota bacterium]
MSKMISKILLALSLLFSTKISFADATTDLWTALKTANYTNALTAIAAGADVKNLDATFGTPLNLASCWADADVVKALIDAKSEINFVSPSNGYTPLMNAASWGNIEAVKLLLAAGGDVHIKTKLGQPILALAITSCKLEIIKLLVDAGANPLDKYSLGTINNLTMMDALIGSKEPEEKIASYTGTATALSKLGVTLPASLINAKPTDYSSLEEIAIYFLDKGCDPNEPSGGWGTIMMQALDFGKTGVAKALIEHGVTAEFDMKKGFKVKDKRGDNAKLPNFTFKNGDFVLVAVLLNNLDFIKLMVDKYPELVKKSYEGSGTMKCIGAATDYNATGINLLMVAAEKGNIDIVKYLISKGAGRGDAVEIKQFKQDKFCPIFSVMFTMGFARASNNQEVIDAVKAAGFGKE